MLIPAYKERLRENPGNEERRAFLDGYFPSLPVLTDCSCHALPRCAGAIPESIGNLTSLQSLELHFNKLQGTFV